MAEPGALAAFLGTIPLLRGLPADAVTRLARRAPAPRVYEPGGRGEQSTVIYDEGAPSTALYIVIEDAPVQRGAASSSGRPVVQVSVEDDKLTARVRLWRVYPRDYFGELEFLAGTEGGRFPARLTRAVALNACRILEIPFKLLNEFIDEHPILFRRLAREAIGHFQQTLEDTLANKVSDPDIALANWIVERARDFGIREGNHVRFRTPISQESIGRDLGVTRETISLRLNEWRRRGLMGSTRGHQFIVRDMERVERIAGLAVERSRDEHHAAVESVNAALDRGDNFRARNFALDVLTYFPGSAELKHRAALAVARCGATREALSLLDRFGFGRDATPEGVDGMVRCGIADPASPPKAKLDDFDLEELNEQIAALGEKDKVATLVEDILALSPRLWKDLAFAGRTLDRDAAEEAFAGYQRAFTASRRPYTGVNAASLAVVLGRTKAGRELTRQVLQRLPRAPERYWDLASKGEALLLQGEEEAAAAAFRTAHACADASEGAIAATRLQLTRLADAGITGARAMLQALPNRPVAVFAGPPASSAANAEELAQLGAAASKEIRDRRIGHLHGGLAPGHEITIVEAGLEQGAHLHVVLPFPVEDYVAAALAAGTAPPGGSAWRERFERCLERASSLTVLLPKAPSAREMEASFVHALRHAAGQALVRADALIASCVMLAPGGDSAALAFAIPLIALAGAPQPSARPGAAGSTPFRPVIFAWLLRAATGEGQLSARGIAETAIDEAETLLRALAGPHVPLLRRLLGGNRPQSALVAVAADAASAIEIAERLLQARAPAGVAIQVTLDFGPVLAASGQPQEERLKDLDMGGGPLEVPDRVLVASAAFTMEARLAIGSRLPLVALGRVARLDLGASAIQLLPSTEIYAIPQIPVAC